MNYFKKTIIWSASVVISMTNIPLMNLHADYNCDVNGDGNITSSDIAAISRYLSGNLNEPYYNKFDVNNSLTVDNMDIQCVLAELQGWNYYCDYFSRATQQYSNANY